MHTAIRHPRIGRFGWAVIIIASFMLLLAGGYAIFAISADRKLQYVIDKYRAAGEPVLAEDFKPTTAPADSNAASHLRAAINAHSIDPEDIKLLYKMTRLPLTPDEGEIIRRVIQSDSGILDEVARARRCVGAEWGVGIEAAWDNRRFTEFQKLREIAWVVRMSALIEHDAGSDTVAVARLGDLLAMGNATRQILPTLVSVYIGCGIDEMVIESIVEMAPDVRIGTGPRAVPASEIRQMIETLRQEQSIRASFALAWQGERAVLVQNIGQAPTPPLVTPLVKIDLARLLEVLAACRQAGLAPDYPKAQSILRAVPIQPSRLGFLPRQYTASAYDSGPKVIFRFLLERRMATVALAIALYRADHGGALPESLDALVPEYLPVLPADPYRTDGHTFGYIRESEWPVLYSYGENGRDDNASTYPTKEPIPLVGWNTEDAVWQLKRLPRPQPEKNENEQ